MVDTKAMAHVTIDSPEGIGFGTLTKLDGQTVHGLTGIDLRIGLDEPNRIILNLLAECGISVRGKVAYTAVLVDPTDGYGYVVAGDSFIEVVAGLHEAVKRRHG